MKKVTWLLLALIISIAVISCGGRPSGAKNIIIYEWDGNTDEVILENQYLLMRFLPETTGIILTCKETGAQWRSNPEEIDPRAAPVTRYMQESVFALEYANVYGIGMFQYSGEQSISLGVYEYDIVNGGLEVNYTVGNIERTYIIPPAVTEERMLYFMGKMSMIEQSLLNSGYRLYDLNNLRRNDDRDELLAKYPNLTRTNIYALRDEVHEYQKAEFENYFSNAGYTYDEYLTDISMYPTLARNERPSFNITLRYTLEGRSLVLDIPFEKIAYRAEFPITTLSVMPYFGAGYLEDEGYVLVPDGAGSLIYFNNGKHNQQFFNSVVYGWDEARVRKEIVSDNRSPMPIYGIQRNGNAILAVIENGSSYASVRADVSSPTSSYNYVYPRFTMVHSEIMNISGRSQRDVYQYERSLPEGERITIRYILCKEEGYVGMAKEYREYLLNKYPTLGKRNDGAVAIAVEIPGAVNKTQHRAGIPFDLPLRLTSYKEAADMINDFANFGWKNVNVKLNGWFNYSVEHSVPSKIKLIRELGSKKDFENLVNTANQKNFNLYPEVDFFFMRDTRPFDGFSLYNDASRSIDRRRIERYPFSFVWFGERTRWGKLSYVARPDTMMSMIDNFVEKSSGFGLDNIAFRNIGSRLAGDYNERQHVSREGSKVMRQEKLAQLTRGNTGIMLLAGHAFAAPFADFIVDMPLDCQHFGITDVSIPFYPMVLHGLVPFTGKAINLAEDYTRHLLKTVESGAGLYFSFMTEDTSVLQETKFRQFYANVYHKWVKDADALYKRFNADFGHLYNQAIVNHTIVSEGSTITEYEDGTRVAVNVSGTGINYSGRYVGANNYVVLRRGN
ncbi:MAG: DUF5696 domain-containing protein [Treponema sp.]|nr:DUF5696 domain-containing protein [Treponema sp.]